MSQPTWLICFAVKEEAAPFRRVAGSHPEEVRTLITGMGWRNAENSFRTAIAENRPDRVITSGFAGGVNPELPSGMLVYSDKSTLPFPSPGATRVRPARFHCVERIAVTAMEKQQIRAATGAEVIEMESGVIERTCLEFGIPCLTLRVILDAAGEDLPLNFNALLNEQDAVDPVKLAMALVRNPGRVPALIQFQKRVKSCAETLGRTLNTIVVGNAG